MSHHVCKVQRDDRIRKFTFTRGEMKDGYVLGTRLERDQRGNKHVRIKANDSSFSTRNSSRSLKVKDIGKALYFSLERNAKVRSLLLSFKRKYERKMPFAFL